MQLVRRWFLIAMLCAASAACSKHEPMRVEGVAEDQYRGDIVSAWAMAHDRVEGDIGKGGNTAIISPHNWNSLGYDERRGVVAYLAHWAWMRADIADESWPSEINVIVNDDVVAIAPVVPGQTNELKAVIDRQVDEAEALVNQLMRGDTVPP